MADISALLTENARILDFVYGASRTTGANTPLSSGNQENPLHLADGPPQASLNPRPVSVSGESVRLADGPPSADLNPRPVLVAQEAIKVSASGQIDLIGPEPRIHVQDMVTAAMDLLASVSESLKVVDDRPPSAQITNTISASGFDESLKIQDSASVELSDKYASVSESLKLADTPSGTVDPEAASPAESLKIQDTVAANIPGLGPQASVQETARIGEEGPWASIGNLFAGPVETYHLVDASDDSGAEIVFAESLKLAESVSILINPEQASPSEAAKIAEALAVTLDPLQSTPAESLKIADTASMVTDLLATPAAEALKIADTVLGPTLDPLQSTLGSENVHVVDTLTSNIGGLTAQASNENVKIADSVTTSLNPLQSVPSESLKVQDTASAATDVLQALMSEALKLADSVTGPTLDPEQATVTIDSLKVQDSVTAALGASSDLTIQVTAEGLRISESLSAVLDLTVVLSLEALKIADAITAHLDSGIAVSESLKVADQAQASLTVLQASANEALVISETFLVFGDIISVEITAEGMRIRDSVHTVPVDPDPEWVCVVPADDWTMEVS